MKNGLIYVTLALLLLSCAADRLNPVANAPVTETLWEYGQLRSFSGNWASPNSGHYQNLQLRLRADGAVAYYRNKAQLNDPCQYSCEPVRFKTQKDEIVFTSWADCPADNQLCLVTNSWKIVTRTDNFMEIETNLGVGIRLNAVR